MLMVNKKPSQPTEKTLRQVQSQSDVFVGLFEADRNRLYAYIYAYVMNRAAADDIFQETSMTLWREFKRFELGTNFSKWANGIAFNRIRVFRRNNKKYSLGLSEELMLEIGEVMVQDKEAQHDDRWQHLQHCCSLLPPSYQQLYESFYIHNHKAQQISDQTDRSIFAIRKSIHKLRKKLFDCVDRKIKGA